MANASATETELLTGYRPLYVWPHIETKELEAAKEALPELLSSVVGADQVAELGLRLGDGGFHSEVLVPREFFGADPEGPQQLIWTDALAKALGYRQLRYGRQDRYPRYKTRLFLGFSEELSLDEQQFCHDLKLRQLHGKSDWGPGEGIVNEDASQTLEYLANEGMSPPGRLDRLHKLVLRKIGPSLNRLVASNVDVELLPDIEIPSLFGDYVHGDWHDEK